VFRNHGGPPTDNGNSRMIRHVSPLHLNPAWQSDIISINPSDQWISA